MKRINTHVMLAALTAFAFTVQAEHTTPPVDPAYAFPEDTPVETLSGWDSVASSMEAREAQLIAAVDPEPEEPRAAESAPALPAAVVPSAYAAVAEEPVVAVPMDEQEAAMVVIPLIVMDEVPLMDAIRNLARQAQINYMVDPRVPYGQPGPDGREVPQPILSIRWENVTAEQALHAVLNNYNLQLTEDPRARISRISIKDPAAPDPLVTKVIQLKYASPSNVVAAVQQGFVDRRSKIVPDVRTSQIVVISTEKEMVDVERIVDQLDTPTKQVLIEARLYETTVNPKTVKGVDWTGTLKDQRVTFGNAPDGSGNIFAQTVGRGMAFTPDTFFLTADGLSIALNFLNEHAESRAVATPRAVTLDNENARLEVTRAYPIFKNTAGTQGSPGGSEVTYTNLGVILNVTPRISANDTVNLHVLPEVSDIFDTTRKVVAGEPSEADIYDIRRIETRVLIPSGNTLVLGGLLRDRTREGNIKVPILGDIPGLGLLFRQDSKERSKINLITFITPTIVQDSDFQPTSTDYLKTRFDDTEEKEWSAWDSGKPHSWTKKQ